MTDPTTAKQRWLSAVWPFIQAHLPPAPASVLEIGCGPAGGFVPTMRERGYHAVGVDPAAPSAPGYHQTQFEHHELTGPFDAIVACTSLHHVDNPGHVLDHAAAALRTDGTLIVIEWAYETFDEATARWCFDRLPDSGEQGWLHRHRELWHASDQPWHTYLDAWARRENLHSGHAITQALQARFHTRLLTQAPYFFPDLYPTTQTDEEAAADSGEIRATGVRYIATKPAISVSPIGRVHDGRPAPGNSAPGATWKGDRASGSCDPANARAAGTTVLGPTEEASATTGRHSRDRVASWTPPLPVCWAVPCVQSDPPGRSVVNLADRDPDQNGGYERGLATPSTHAP